MGHPAITSERQSRPTQLLGIDMCLLLIDDMHEAVDILDLAEESKMPAAAHPYRRYCLATTRAHHDFLARHHDGKEMPQEVSRTFKVG